jgi:hypothetical protein
METTGRKLAIGTGRRVLTALLSPAEVTGKVWREDVGLLGSTGVFMGIFLSVGFPFRGEQRAATSAFHSRTGGRDMPGTEKVIAFTILLRET